MTSYHIDTFTYQYSNDDIHLGIKYLLSAKSTEYNSYQRLLCIGDLIQHITNEKLLNNTLNLMQEASFLGDFEYVNNIISKKCHKNPSYNEADYIKIKSIIFGSMFKFEVLLKAWKGVLKKNAHVFNFNIIKREVLTSDGELLQLLKKNATEFMVSKFSKISDVAIRSLAINNAILAAAKKDYDNDTNSFDKQIHYLKTVKDHLPLTDVDSPKYPFIAIGAKEKFIEYISKHIVDVHLDFSFLYQMMVEKSFITKMGHTQFADWLLKNKYVNEREFNKLLKSNQLASLKNSHSDERLNKFTNTFSPLNKG